jgi:hypothetical protein
MGDRDAPPAPHPAPAPDWVLGSDGHWKPPPMTGDGMSRRPGTARTVVQEAPATHRTVGPAVIVAVILVIAALAYLAQVALGA